MKVVILAGGQGTRLMPHTRDRPKALVPIGGVPLLRQVMDSFADQGLREFVIGLGHRAEQLRAAVAAWAVPADWHVDLVDTGDASATGSRVHALLDHIGNQTFLLAWTDGLTDLDVRALQRTHEDNAGVATIVVIRQPPRFGRVTLSGSAVARFEEKPADDERWVHAGIAVVEPSIASRLAASGCDWDRDVLGNLARDGKLFAYRHEGYWRCVDTPADKFELDSVCEEGAAPWRRARSDRE